MNDKNLRAILLMIASMSAFSAADTLVKISTASMAPSQVTVFLFGGGLIIFALMAILQGEDLLDSRALKPILMVRYVSEVAGLIGMVMALASVPISTVGAITQASPLLAAVGAVIFLNEKVGWRRWLSFAVGFIGVLLIVQPGGIEFEVSVLWALLAMVALAVRDLTTRLVPADMPSASLATFTMVAALPMTIVWVYFSGETLFPKTVNWWVVLPMIVLGSLGYMLLIASIRKAEVSVVMPYRYSRILFLLILGVVVFGEKPEPVMLLGAALIILSGVYVVWREKLGKQM